MVQVAYNTVAGRGAGAAGPEMAQPAQVTLYDVILSDPPWHFQNWGADEPGETHDRSRGANRYYPTVRTADICTMKPPAADNAALFLWATWPHMPDALRVIDAWGFEYKSVAWVWVKANRSGFGHFMGMGYYTRANSEPCLLAVRGKMPVAARDVLALIYSPVREHSRKPDEQYDKIDRLYPTGQFPRRLEMFARRTRPGWDVFGNEVENSVRLDYDLSPFEELLLAEVRQLRRDLAGPVPTALLADSFGRGRDAMRYWLRKLEAKQLVYRLTRNSGWLPTQS